MYFLFLNHEIITGIDDKDKTKPEYDKVVSKFANGIMFIVFQKDANIASMTTQSGGKKILFLIP